MNIFKKITPTSLWIIGGLVVVGGICWYLGGWSWMMNYWSRQQYINSIENLKEAYRQDTYGAETPEGTLKLFIEAFEKEDADLASKYFVIEKQEEYRDSLINILSNKRKDIVIKSLLSYDQKKCYEYSNTCVLSSYDKNTGIWSISKLILNESSNLWKIKDL